MKTHPRIKKWNGNCTACNKQKIKPEVEIIFYHDKPNYKYKMSKLRFCSEKCYTKYVKWLVKELKKPSNIIKIK